MKKIIYLLVFSIAIISCSENSERIEHIEDINGLNQIGPDVLKLLKEFKTFEINGNMVEDKNVIAKAMEDKNNSIICDFIDAKLIISSKEKSSGRLEAFFTTNSLNFEAFEVAKRNKAQNANVSARASSGTISGDDPEDHNFLGFYTEVLLKTVHKRFQQPTYYKMFKIETKIASGFDWTAWLGGSFNDTYYSLNNGNYDYQLSSINYPGSVYSNIKYYVHNYSRKDATILFFPQPLFSGSQYLTVRLDADEDKDVSSFFATLGSVKSTYITLQ